MKFWSFRRERIQWNFLAYTADSECENFPTFRDLTPSPSSGCCWWFGNTKTDDWVSSSTLRLGRSRDGKRSLWLVGEVKRSLHLVWAVYFWLWQTVISKLITVCHVRLNIKPASQLTCSLCSLISSASFKILSIYVVVLFSHFVFSNFISCFMFGWPCIFYK
jgi:hypothetical protein